MCTEPTTLIRRRRKDNYQSERSVSNKKPKDQSTHTNRNGFVASAATITVVVKLASVTTEGCSVACVVIFAAAVVRDSRYDNLGRCILYGFGNLDLQSGRGQGGMGKEGMGCNCVYAARIRHVTLRLLYTATQHEWQRRCSCLSEQAHVCYIFNIQTYAKSHCSWTGAS